MDKGMNIDVGSGSNGLKGASSTEDIHTVENGPMSAKANGHSTPCNDSSSSIISPPLQQVNNGGTDLQPTRACIMTALSIASKNLQPGNYVGTYRLNSDRITPQHPEERQGNLVKDFKSPLGCPACSQTRAV
ncbi:hypothetical protein RP20_CCG022339 [Aedes albopictus]|nr:hypothetical protein RP20_CCG022339 [Aedes albopictus]